MPDTITQKGHVGIALILTERQSARIEISLDFLSTQRKKGSHILPAGPDGLHGRQPQASRPSHKPHEQRFSLVVGMVGQSDGSSSARGGNVIKKCIPRPSAGIFEGQSLPFGQRFYLPAPTYERKGVCLSALLHESFILVRLRSTQLMVQMCNNQIKPQLVERNKDIHKRNRVGTARYGNDNPVTRAEHPVFSVKGSYFFQNRINRGWCFHRVSLASKPCMDTKQKTPPGRRGYC
ncbi:hypothetical protein GEO60473_12600 [Geobacter sp. 60473]|nr:hypothetical protein GEO60473_12600 [Geobacter sp. 60473]